MTEENDGGRVYEEETYPIEYYLNNETEPNMEEVSEIIKNLQERLKNAGGGEIVITDKNFTIKFNEGR